MVLTQVLPAAYKHQANLVAAVKDLSNILGDSDAVAVQKAEVASVAGLIAALNGALKHLDEAVEKAEAGDKAAAFAYEVSDAMSALRDVCDKLEVMVDDNLWPLPKYREMLFLV
jgi:glutamine synthetase